MLSHLGHKPVDGFLRAIQVGGNSGLGHRLASALLQVRENGLGRGGEVEFPSATSAIEMSSLNSSSGQCVSFCKAHYTKLLICW